MEKTFYDDPEICVTSERLIVRGKSLPIEGVLSVEQTIDEPARIGPPAVSFGGSLLAAVIALSAQSPSWALVFLVCSLIAALWMGSRQPSHLIFIVKPEGRILLLDSHNEDFARAVYKAIEGAIAHRRSTHSEHG